MAGPGESGTRFACSSSGSQVRTEARPEIRIPGSGTASVVARQSQFLDFIVDAIPCLVFVKRADDLTYVRINRVAREALGLSGSSVIGKTDLEVLAFEDAARIQADDRRVVASRAMGEAFEEELRTRRGARWFCTRKVPVVGVEGLPEVLLTFSEDITEQRELRTTSEMWDQVFHHAERGIVVGSPDGDTLEMMNPAFPLMFGYTLEELAGKPLIDIFAPEARADVPAMFELVRLSGQHTFESVCVRKDGGTFPVLVDATSVKDALGNVHHRAIRVQDTTLLKSKERALRADRTEAERANEAKSQFLSRMSHELRTPLNVILGFAQVMQLDGLNGTQDESVGHILQSGRHLLALIDEALDISRVESGHLALSLEAVKVAEPVLEVLGLLRQMAETDGVRLFGSDVDSGCYVIADRHRLKQVLMNLVANAIKYNVRGGYVRVECKREGPVAAISVTDTGIGFPKGSTDRLFSPFDRLGQEAGEVEGTGLGLSLSKALVEAMGGSITAAPNTEAGSVFTVRLKASERADAAPEAFEPVADGHGQPSTEGLVLYIEDNLANFRLVEQVLARRPGVRVLPAMQARMGLQLALDHQPDLILLDLHLPDMSGEETLQRLFRNPMTRSIPVVIASADATPRRLQRLLSLGARAYLTKPIDIRLLLETIDSLLLEGQAGHQEQL